MQHSVNQLNSPTLVHYYVHQSPYSEPHESSSRSSAQSSQQSGNHLKILGTWRVTRRQFRMEDQQILGNTIQNFVAMATWGSEICVSLPVFIKFFPGSARSVSLLSSNLYQRLPSDLLFQGYPSTPSRPFLLSPIRTIYTPHIFSLSSYYCTANSTNHKAPYYVILSSLLLIPPSYV